MGNSLVLTFVTVLSFLLSRANAARACGNEPKPSTYQWRINAVRYDGADPSSGSGDATVAVSISPNSSTLFECVAEWPEEWAGWYEGGSNIIWSDCIWTGNGPRNDNTVSFATDWKNKTMYLTHSFDCSDREGTDALATGFTTLDMNCTEAVEGTSHCVSVSNDARLAIVTEQEPARLDVSSACADNSNRYQSWELEEWHRRYEMAPESTVPPPEEDTDLSFTLRNMANTDVFNCTISGKQLQNATLDGVCESTAGEANPTTAANFRFDPERDMLTITQQWNCSDLSSFETVGIGYVQATCDRKDNILTCTSDPIWIGTKTV
ncbi:hypothetical protein QBC33DRAFT_462861 [Phialemonium atrogriseum]|uniref:Ig-like domain-containing protein n=1 Tax=Phialemonium atrogriseum TaxID=1093897 RepID=A0AAJ0FAS4_9PEZI|nr:uncharacterized protein QBC33DRAFT_462861 [Phialemonium atrogriseum]KAK1761696.1 hypothetical protein QBC33DRAFT_462861 [Phialemonium atrogriseum]